MKCVYGVFRTGFTIILRGVDLVDVGGETGEIMSSKAH